MRQRLSFVDSDVISLYAPDQVLRIGSGGMMYVAFEPDVRHHLFNDHTANTAGFGIPFHDVAALERLGHVSI